MKKLVFLMLVASAITFTSCGEDEPINNNEEVGSYKFERNGKSTVSFSGQSARLKMLGILSDALKDNTKTEVQLDNMFTNTSNPFSDSDLNFSGKNIRGKVAASVDFFGSNTTASNVVKGKFDALIADQVNEVFTNWQNDASEGVAGKLGNRYINEKGVELNQFFAKGLIGALIADQILNNYLSQTKLGVDNDSNKEGKNYTEMEHHWDEAYGYLYGLEPDAANPKLGADHFLNGYLKQVNSNSSYNGIADDVFRAFKKGREAIVSKNYGERDRQAEIIREKISKVLAIRTIHYLQAGKNALNPSDNSSAFHALSEGLGFLYSLQFTRKPNTNEPYMSKAKVDQHLDKLLAGNGLWKTTVSDDLEQASKDIANAFGLKLADAAK